MSFLLDYADRKVEIDDALFENIDDIAIAMVLVITGDEVLSIVHRNGDVEEVSTYSACMEYYDGEYPIIKDGKWIIDKDTWDSRKTSYDILDGTC